MDIMTSFPFDPSSALRPNSIFGDYFNRNVIEEIINSGNRQNWEIAGPSREPSKAFFLLQLFFIPCIFTTDSMFPNEVCHDANFFELSTHIYSGVAVTMDGEFLLSPMWLSDLFPELGA